MAKDVEHFFLCLLVFFMSLFEKYQHLLYLLYWIVLVFSGF